MKTLYGVIHLAALPGAPESRQTLDGVEERALQDGRRYAQAGFTGVLVENYGDKPFHPEHVGPETIAAMARIARALRQALPELALGVNVLRNDGEAALAVAHAAGADFIRVNVLSGLSWSDQGALHGRAARILRLRKAMDSSVRIFADVDVKHGRMAAHADALEQAEDLVGRAGADALIVTGRATGQPPEAEQISRLRERIGDFPLIVGSGLSADNAAALLAHADGAIVGTSVKVGRITQRPVDLEAAKRLAAAVAALEPERQH
jgi:hypothetical protein